MGVHHDQVSLFHFAEKGAVVCLAWESKPALLVLHHPSVHGEKLVSCWRAQPQALSDEGCNQALGPLLVLPQHLMGCPDLVALQAVQECHTNNSSCRMAEALRYLTPDYEHPLPQNTALWVADALLLLPSPELSVGCTLLHWKG